MMGVGSRSIVVNIQTFSPSPPLKKKSWNKLQRETIVLKLDARWCYENDHSECLCTATILLANHAILSKKSIITSDSLGSKKQIYY
jgi:hypothetical protein